MANDEIPDVPAVHIAAPKGCIRVTVKNYDGDGASIIFNLETLQKYLRAFENAMDSRVNSPGKMLDVIKQIAAEKNKDESMLPFMGLGALWISKSTDKSMISAIKHIASVHGRVVLYVQEHKDGSWAFTAGRETGINESSPISGGSIVR